MPLFFFISGFTLNIDKIYGTKFLPFLEKNVKRLLIPYYWIYLILMIPEYIRIKFILHDDFSLKDHLIGMFLGNSQLKYPMTAGPLYFLLVLFCSQLLLYAVIKVSKGNFKTIFAICTVLLSITLCTYKIDMPWHIDSVPAAAFMICIGRVIMDFYLSHKDLFKSLSHVKYLLAIVVLLGFGFLIWKYNGRVSLNGNYFGEDFVLCIISAVSTGFALTMIAMRLPKSKALTFIGCNTLFYMGAHNEMMRYLNTLFPKYKSAPWFIIAATIFIALSLIPITTVIQKFQPYITGVTIKQENKSIEAGKCVAVFAVTVIPFIFVIRKFFSGFLSSNIMLIFSTIIYLGLCVLITFALNKLFPIIFLQDKKSAKQN